MTRRNRPPTLPSTRRWLVEILLISALLAAALAAAWPGARFPVARAAQGSASAALQAASCSPPPGAEILSPYLFGVINDQGTHYADEWSRGIRATTFELHWNLYEPFEGVYDQAYVAHMQQVLASLEAQGWHVQLIPGYHYVPDWVFANYPGMHYVNQYGEAFDPDPRTQGDLRIINAPFNPQARALIARYLERLFQDFPAANFDSIRVGGGVQGELRYPPGQWNGRSNAYWAFDAHAQNPAESGLPAAAAGWRPGIDPNPGSVGRGQLLVNPGFERNHPRFAIFGWSVDDEVEARLGGQQPHSGALALQLTIRQPHRVHQYVRAEPGATYQFGAWLRSGGGQARFFVTQYGADWQPVAGATFAKLESGDAAWSQRSGSLAVSSETRYLKIELDGDRPGDYFFDDLWLKRSGEANGQDRDVDTPLAFFDWYVQALTAYQNWQIAEIRRHSSAQLDVLYAGKGLMSDHLIDALNNDLHGDGWSESSRALYAAGDYDRHVAGLPTDGKIALYLTGVEDPPASAVDDASPYPGDWSAARWLAWLADRGGFAIWGENTGRNDRDEMRLALERTRANGFIGLMWGFESQLYAGPGSGYAAIEDFQAEIAPYALPCRAYLPAIQ